VVAVCAGQRCTALRGFAGCGSALEELRDAVRLRRGAVLVSSPCLGPCHEAPVAAVARRDGPTGDFGRTLWLGRLDDAVLLEALRAWVVGGGPSTAQRPEKELPAELAPAMLGVGPPMRHARGDG
jgi:hypothetical protein